MNSPRTVFKEAYSVGLINSADDWLSMITDRNMTSHTYDEQMAFLVCERITTQHVHVLDVLFHSLKRKVTIYMIQDNVLQQVISLLTSYPGVEEIYLFGSRSNGTASERSDYDIAIRTTGISDKEFNLLALQVQEEVFTLHKN
ncbi:hypothetical protein GCM10020331_103220 [Ectobacillus funiculus]